MVLTLYEEILAVCSVNLTKYINTPCVEMQKFLVLNLLVRTASFKGLTDGVVLVAKHMSLPQTEIRCISRHGSTIMSSAF
jgi:hypothetical protein